LMFSTGCDSATLDFVAVFGSFLGSRPDQPDLDNPQPI
jgi:hypothetical protein